jgi:ligand-binding sensor domain-containing protein
MIRKILFIAAWFFPFGMQAAAPTSQEVVNQLVRNAHGGMEVYTINGVTSYFGYVGTGYVHYFYEQRAYVKPELDLKFGEFKHQSAYSVKTTSLALPVTVGYHVFQQESVRMTLFGGGRYEQILSSTDNTYSSPVNNSQVGLTAGTSLRLLNNFSINAAYYYGLTSLFKDGSGRIRSFSLSFNF